MSHPKGSPFYMVYREGGGPPTVKHARYDLAEQEAKRISNASPGFNVFILAAVSRVKVPKHQEQEFYESQHDTVPF